MGSTTSAQETRVLKLVAALFITLSFASIAYAQTPASTCEPEISDWARDELKGQVKAIKRFEASFNVSEKTGRHEKSPRYLQTETEYDVKGNRDGGGATFSVPQGMEFTAVRYVCTDKGQLKEIRHVTKDGSSYPRTTWVYDEKGRSIEETDYYQDGSIDTKDTYVYDSAGNVIEKTRMTSGAATDSEPKREAGFLTTKRTLRYDARGNKIEEKHFHADGVLYATWFFNYDANDRMIKETRLDKLGRIERQVFYEYDGEGRPLSEISFGNSCTERKNDTCKGYISTGDGFFTNAFKTKYQYDSQGNWIKQTEWYMDGEVKKPVWELSAIIKREITYHRN